MRKVHFFFQAIGDQNELDIFSVPGETSILMKETKWDLLSRNCCLSSHHEKKPVGMESVFATMGNSKNKLQKHYLGP